MGAGSKESIKAITDGTAMTEALRATYLMAAANKGDIDARGADEPVVTPAGAVETPDAAADQVADAVEAALGYEEGGTV
jgi:hypothetical protein